MFPAFAKCARKVGVRGMDDARKVPRYASNGVLHGNYGIVRAARATAFNE